VTLRTEKNYYYELDCYQTADKSLQSEETKMSKKREEGSAVSAVLQMEKGPGLNSVKYGGRT